MTTQSAEPSPSPRSIYGRLAAACAFFATTLVPALVEATANFGARMPPAVAAAAIQGLPELNPDSIASKPLVLMVALGALSLVPFLILMVTSFVKISVVLSIIRSALGTQQIPPTQVITGLAIILTIYIMAPVGLDMYRSAGSLFGQSGELLSTQSVGLLVQAANKAKEPMREFLLKHSTLKDRNMFYNLAKRLRHEADREDISDRDFMICIPSFVISELKQAFQIGFILFVPFIVIDMVVANILLALGMHMLSPTIISMPFKLLLFVLVDGWYMITKGLIISYL